MVRGDSKFKYLTISNQPFNIQLGRQDL